ncbi:MAG: hypothetical protein A2X35_10445 [Elusimicrobia bacterium GWA2_61_42]|nr:MAG: hypothetical protein A2X35_10445 [Elusimicrobia bacterium GWA2_61_42]OGR74680.1 MAG: hypothetical protein A2X38_02410 [Elusimicrobia bacterium GWC2_61_25]
MKKYSWFIAIFAAAALAVTASAQQKPAQKNPCARDGAKFCASSENFRAFIKCLKKNNAALTEGCRSRVDAAMAASGKMKKSCKDDTARLCKTSGPKALQCLMQNESKLSPGCQGDLREWKKLMTIIPASLRNKGKTQ